MGTMALYWLSACPIDAVGCSDTGTGTGGSGSPLLFLAAVLAIAVVTGIVLAVRRRRG
jgi:LPXTG-motif cell wall-anchored protein